MVELELSESVTAQTPLPLRPLVSQLPVVERLPEGLEEEIQRLKARLRRLGSVNPNAPDEYAEVQEHADLDAFMQDINPRRLFALSTHATTSVFNTKFEAGDTFVFGPETRGLPKDLLASLPVEQVLRLPMLPTNRSLNLANAAAVVVYEAWRQIGFSGAIS